MQLGNLALDEVPPEGAKRKNAVAAILRRSSWASLTIVLVSVCGDVVPAFGHAGSVTSGFPLLNTKLHRKLIVEPVWLKNLFSDDI